MEVKQKDTDMKDNKIAVPLKAKLFELDQVTLLDGLFKDAMDHNAEWLLSLEPDRFLAWFRKEAGLKPKGRVYGGWEKETIAGHSLGHYLSACAMMYAATGEKEYNRRTAYIVDELTLVQDAHGNGYMSAFPNGKKAFEEISRGEIRSGGFDLNGIWVPWYTQHKLMAGLYDVYRCTKNQKALDVWVRHADWIDSVVANLTEQQWQKMLACEHGGINESFAQLYGVTGDKKYLRLAKKFYHKSVLDPLSRRKNPLSGLHANTQVPKAIGAARIYELTGEERFATIADFFWSTVVNHYTYANGGNSAEEHFSKPDVLGDRMHDTTETCNTYNMLKLTRHLFTWRPDSTYMDYYERALLNHILAHQHPEKGGALVYKGFLDMPARKGFSHPTESFWCCVGTGMENHTRYADTIYAYNDDSLYVNLFISSKLTWEQKNITLEQQSQLPTGDSVTLSFGCGKPAKLSLKIRKPYWVDSMEIAVNRKPQKVEVGTDGYITLSRKFRDGDVVELKMPQKLHTSTLPDLPNRTAFLYGPTLLAAILEEGQSPPMLVGNDTNSILRELKQTQPLNFTSKTIAYQPGDNGWEKCELKMIPLYKVAEQSYTVYIDTFTPTTWQKKQAEYAAELEQIRKLQTAGIDLLRIGQMQPERDHNLTSENSHVGQFQGKKWRAAYNGWFEFDMKVVPDAPVDLVCTYWGSERGRRTFDILVDGEKIATQKLGQDKPGEFFNVTYQIPVELTKDKDKVRIRFQSHPGNYAGGLFDAQTTKR
ncbi:MAG: glycoside hydrolase family 127 protein [Sedimentisphaerales bacterium]|nr:glycoside hydrolase family 127 protein [Sedimentisphaerales bacterium]